MSHETPFSTQSNYDKVSPTYQDALQSLFTAYLQHQESAPVCLHALLEMQATRTPDAVAIVYADTQLTYATLLQRANQLAWQLQAHGVVPDQLVGVCLERSVEMIIGLIAVLKAGGAYVPLDPEYPMERLSFMLLDAEVSVLLTQRHVVQKLPDTNALVLCLDSAVVESPAIPLQTQVSGDNLAYMIYTSGSTGTPKGALNTHRAICNRLIWMQTAYHLVATDRILQKTPFSFDVSVWEFFWPLITGACLVFAQPGGHRDAGYLVQLIQEQAITVTHFVPSMLSVFLTHPQATRCRSLRHVVCSGEALPYNLQERFFALLPAQLHNLYGPTEAAIDVTAWTCERSSSNRKVPIGRPIAHIQTYILDQSLNLSPPGESGELYLGGIGLARGYFKRPALTAERFLPHPYSDIPGERLYKTGDLARYLPDGALEFLGRSDNQVKLHGFRIELAEIEDALTRDPNVDKAVVALHTSALSKQPSLVGYVVSKAGAVITAFDLQENLRKWLPEYMIPAQVVFLAAFPLTPNGKIDRQALPTPQAQRPSSHHSSQPPRDALEDFLLDCWQEALGVKDISNDEHFFELGGNSISAAMVMNRVQEKLGAIIHVVVLFDAPTINTLAAYLRTHYAPAVARAFPELSLSGNTSETSQIKKVSAVQVQEIRQLIQPLPPLPQKYAGAHKNPPAIFVLSPPRSGTTLMRVMLGGHPQLFSPPDLELLSFNTLQERKNNFSARDSSWLEGTIRAIMEIRQCDASTATRLMADFEAQNLTAQQFYGVLQEWLGEKILVDKSVEYALDIEALKRAEEYFSAARYIHLVRNPYGMIQSMQDVRLDQVYFRHKHPFTPRELAELVWLVCHQNILQFLQNVPAERQQRIRFEDLVKQPETTIRRLCDFLSIDFYPDMLEPHKGQRMTDGIHAVSRMLGDMKFHTHKHIDARVADRWMEQHNEDFLAEETWQMAEKLGYTRPAQAPVHSVSIATNQPLSSLENMAIRPLQRGAGLILPPSFAQQSLWLLDQLTPANPFYIIPMALRMQGKLDLAALQSSLREVVRRHEVLRTTFTAVQGIPAQIIPPVEKSQMPHVPLVDLSALAQEQHTEVTQQLVYLESRHPFALENDLLLRATLVRIAPEEHLLLIMLHHIATDGWSQNVLLKELSALYKAYSNKQEPTLPDLPLQYADYALWHRQFLTEAVLQRQLAYWKEQLADLPLLNLPTDFPRPAVETFRGAQVTRAFPLSLLTGIKQLSQQRGVTLFMTVCAAFQVLLARYSGQRDIPIGTSIAYRRQRDLEGLIGFFMNTIILRGDLSDDPPFVEFLARVYQQALAAYANQDVPFEQVVHAVQPTRDLSRSTLYQVLFQLQQQDHESFLFPDLTTKSLAIDNGTAKCDIFLNLSEGVDSFTCRVEYNTDIFSRERIERMQEHFQHLLEMIVAHPQQRVSELQFLGEEQAQQILVAWNDTQTAYPATQCVHELVEQQAERAPDAIALVSGAEQFTYSHINQRANQLAHILREQGIGPDVCVGLYLEPTSHMIIALLAVLKAGGAYLPLDLASPLERLEFMLKDAGATLLLTQQHLLERLPLQTIHIMSLDQAAERHALARESDANLAIPTCATNLAYVIYTSGSTGTPKGVSIVHQAIVRLLCQTNYIDIHADDVIAQASTIAFDAATFEIWGALMHGARLVLLEKETVLSPQRLAQQIAHSSINILFLTTAVFNQIAQQHPATFTPLRYLLFGGEAVDTRWVQAVLTHGAPETLLHVYGPTESTTYATWYHITEIPEGAPTIPIGAALANTQLYVLDANLQPVAPGFPGELFIGGAGLARGYLNQPRLTATQFIPDPFSKEPGRRLYRTGDIVRWRADGQIEFIGRRDAQVKIRGLRIELGEIEAVLARHPQVQQMVVLVREGQAGNKQLIAYIVRDNSQSTTLDQQALQRYLREHLPEYMIPPVFVFLQQFPLNQNGKIDRQALPQPQATDVQQVRTLPRNPVEQALSTIWQQVLKIDPPGIHDNFFTLGGDSILSIQMVSRARQAGLQITPRQIFLHSTIAALAGTADTAPTILAIQELFSGSLPLTPIQHWFFAQAFPMPQHFNQAMVLDIRRQISPALLRQALYHLLWQHDALRMRFHKLPSGQWQQQNAGTEALQTIPFEEFDLSMAEAQEREAIFLRLVNEAQGSLDLAHGPIVQACYIKMSPAEPDRLLLIIHHLVVDGISWRILVEDLGRICEQLMQDQRVELPPKTLAFGQWAQHLLYHSKRTAWDQTLQDWISSLQQPSASLPLDFSIASPEQANTFAQARTITVTLEEQPTRALLQQLPAAYHTQINDVLLTALAQTLTNWLKTTSVLISLEGHGREELFAAVDLTRTVGWFTSVFPVSLSLAEISDSVAALQAIKEQLQRIPHRGMSYGLLRYLRFTEQEQLQRFPTPQISFNYLGQFDQIFTPAALFAPSVASYGTLVHPDNQRSHLLQINARVQQGVLSVSWTYGSRFHSEQTIVDLAKQYLVALKVLISRAYDQSSQQRNYIPADFPAARLDKNQLNTLFSKIKQGNRKGHK